MSPKFDRVPFSYKKHPKVRRQSTKKNTNCVQTLRGFTCGGTEVTDSSIRRWQVGIVWFSLLPSINWFLMWLDWLLITSAHKEIAQTDRAETDAKWQMNEFALSGYGRTSTKRTIVFFFGTVNSQGLVLGRHLYRYCLDMDHLKINVFILACPNWPLCARRNLSDVVVILVMDSWLMRSDR